MKEGYEDYISEIISVEYDIVKKDIFMNPLNKSTVVVGTEQLLLTGEGSNLFNYLIGVTIMLLGVYIKRRKVMN